MARSRVKITVLKRVDPSVIFDGNVPDRPDGKKYTICTAFEDGQEFIVEKNLRMPEGFCGWAWRDIYKDLSVLAMGGDFDPWVEKGKMITCCTDGIRPVSFTMERLEDQIQTKTLEFMPKKVVLMTTSMPFGPKFIFGLKLLGTYLSICTT